MSLAPLPTVGDAVELVVTGVWQRSGRTPSTIAAYLAWVRRYRLHQAERGAVAPEGLTTFDETRAFAIAYARRRGCVFRHVFASARSALRAWSCALRSLGRSAPPWRAPKPGPRLSPMLKSFRDYRVQHGGIAASTLRGEVCCISEFLGFMRAHGRRLERVRLIDVDAFVQHLAERMKPKSLSAQCSFLRAFLRFLRVSGRLRFDLAPSVVGPRVVKFDRPPKILAWQDVRRLLRGIDVNRHLGRRDLAMLLMMAIYGLGAAEVRMLDLNDIDWKTHAIHVQRPKTGARVELPLLPAVARALADYLKRERPAHATSRAVFVSDRLPHDRLSGAHAIGDRLARHAATAGIDAISTGAHVLRHTHATRQIDLGASPKVVSDILGHRSPSSTSAYVRVALRRLRAIALPVPR